MCVCVCVAEAHLLRLPPQLLLDEKLNTGELTLEVGTFVELLWTEATGCLGDVLTVSVRALGLNDVSVSPRRERDS